MKRLSKEEFEKEYLNHIVPQTFLDWVDDFATQLDSPPPEPTENTTEYFKRVGAWETQMLVYKKLKYAVKEERRRLESIK